MRYWITTFVVAAWAVALAGCGGGGDTPTGTVGDDTSGGSAGGTTGGSGSARPSTFAREPAPGGNFLDSSAFPVNAIVNGCNGRDCIPALTDPVLVHAADGDAGYLRSSDLVMGVMINGEAVAFPHNIGWWHEIVNAQVGGKAISVTFCPLTGTGMVFNGDTEEGRLTLGVSGLLFNNNLIMYDRRDGQTLYPQMVARAVVGPRVGQDLELMPVVETTWGFWKKLYPNTKVVGGNTGLFPSGQYTQYPYTGQGDYRVENSYILFPVSSVSATTALLGAKEMAMGVRFGDLVKAYPFGAMGSQSVINDAIGDNPLVVAYYRQESFAVPFSGNVTGDDGSALNLTFDEVESTSGTYPFMMKDRETGTTWNLKGEAVSGTLAGRRLTQLPSHNGFWFAWPTFWQNLGIY